MKKVQKDLASGKSMKDFSAKAERDKHVERMVRFGGGVAVVAGGSPTLWRWRGFCCRGTPTGDDAG